MTEPVNLQYVPLSGESIGTTPPAIIPAHHEGLANSGEGFL
ncbi:hypothetical protein ACK11Z_03280 [Methanoculleus bourgensis]